LQVDAPRHRSIFSLLSVPAGRALAGLFTAVGVVRRGRPLHPKGVFFDAVLSRTGAHGQWGTAWLDQAGEDHGLVRLSRAVGLPERLPDILGLAFSFRTDDGGRHDLLLATAGLGRISRYLLALRRNPLNSAYTCLFPYTAPRGSLLIAAVPVRPQPSIKTVNSPVSGPISFRMLVAAPRGSWQPFGKLTLTAVDQRTAEKSFRFDPVVYQLPGLSWQRSLAQLGEPAYSAARRQTGAAGD
jgi:hypothetical protein